MELEKLDAGTPAPPVHRPHPRQPEAAGEGCLVVAIRLPVRVVVFLVVLPVRLVWDACAAAARWLDRAVFRPLGRALLWTGRAVFVWPLVGLWRHVLVPLGGVLARLGNLVVVVPAGWLYRYVLVPVGQALVWLYARVLTPLGHGVMWGVRGIVAVLAATGLGVFAVLARLTRYLVVVPCAWLYTWVLTPVGHAVAWCAKGLVRLVGMLVTGIGTGLYWITRILFVLPLLAVWRWVLVPVGRVLAVVAREIWNALGHAWRVTGYVSLAVGRFLMTLFRWGVVEPVRWVYTRVLTPVGHVVRDAVLRPAAAAAGAAGRAVRQSLASARLTLRQARADIRRVLVGEQRPARDGNRREPIAGDTRTLGSSTTALTKD
ncbi:hypothetical protein OH738_26720 [Streptomyces hirsutus]|uniref:hypothetical protein n=1 Tax=Streptomyces TaxID=1883 RepID=UPI0038659A05|nr:hypothetical protein OH738_26720 [Streptomyces hirsutus]WTD75103.1 hypothetical protein OHB56_14905 [Streptomyces sp. NBC_01635]